MSLVDLLSPWIEPAYSGRSICPADLLLLIRYIKRNNVRNVVEFGCGITTQEMKHNCVNLTTFSKDVSKSLKDKNESVCFIECDLFDKSNISIVISKLKNADLLVIDAKHTWEFAEFYTNNYLSVYEGPIWIHDYFAKSLTGEQKYLDKHVISKTHKITLMTDMPEKQLRYISKSIGYDLLAWKRSKVGTTKASLCSIILEKI